MRPIERTCGSAKHDQMRISELLFLGKGFGLWQSMFGFATTFLFVLLG